MPYRRFATACLLAFGLAAAPAHAQEVNDPFENVNRAIFSFNNALDDAVLEPVARGYRRAVPDPVRTGIGNFLSNLASPVVLANDVLQGNFDRAGITLQRFLLNTTAGFGGFVDQASQRGIVAHDEDFGQTLAVWGLGDGPYLMLPFFGPSNPRDASGRLVDSLAIDPVGYVAPIEVSVARFLVSTVDSRAEVLDQLDQLERSSFDFYASVRSIYYQQRRAAIRNGQAGPQQEDIFQDDIYTLDE